MHNGGRLPRLVLIADGFTQPGLDQRIVQSVRYGVEWIILRDHAAKSDIIALSARILVERMRAINRSVRLSLNGPEDMARDLGIGWHRTSKEPFANRTQSGGFSLEGRSTHNISEVENGRREGLDYVLYGHVFETNSHRGEPPRGLVGLKQAVDAAGSMPVIAIGGISPERVRMCREVGAYGAAVLSGLMQAPNLFQAVDAYSQSFVEPLNPE